jgi:N-acyl-D-amino-acid deacylase
MLKFKCSSKLLIVVLVIGFVSCKKAEKKKKPTEPNNQIVVADVLIKNGQVYDGTGSAAVKLDIAIKDQNIVFMGQSNPDNVKATKIIDATDLIVTPGFIDPHTHCEDDLSASDVTLRRNLIYLHQGVTTVLTGNDGYGTTDTKKQLDEWADGGIGTNVGLFVGFGSVRNKVLGGSNVTPNAEQLNAMKALVVKSMQEGAFGLSTALSYVPQSYSKRSGYEVKDLAKVTQPFGGVYDTHLRSQGSGILDAIKEVEEISTYAGNLKVHISHIKSSEEMVDKVIAQMNAARASGINLTANVYPYLASSDGLRSLVPAAYRTNLPVFQNAYNNASTKAIMYNAVRNALINLGDNVEEGAQVLIVSENYLNWRNKSIWEISQEAGTDPVNTILDMLYKKILISVQTHSQSEIVMKKFLKQSYIVTGSDGGRSHPRGAGSFPEVIKRYAVDGNVQSLAQAIWTSSGLTAEIFGIKNRGTLKVGNFADIVVIDLDNYKANSTYANPELYATGVKYVFLNGRLVIQDDIFTGTTAGVAIRKN